MFSQRHGDQLLGKGINPIRLLFDEQGTLFSSKRVISSHRGFSEELQAIPPYIWYATLELALRLMAREPVKGVAERQDEVDDSDPISQLNSILHRVQQIGEWIRLELFHPDERRREILRACQTVRVEISSMER